MEKSLEFNSIDELYKRVTPALYSKVCELRRMGLNYVTGRDIWNYLVLTEWKNRNDLLLHELISDILHLDNYTIYEYVLKRLNKIKNKEEKVSE